MSSQFSRKRLFNKEELNWIGRAACKNQSIDVFFEENLTPQTEKTAKDFCSKCQVQRECLEYALNLGSPIYGIWGGLNSKELQKIKTQRYRAKKQKRKRSS